MATAATSLLGLALPVTGELSGTWGDTVNVSITALLDSAVAGTTTLSSDADVTLTTTTLAANQARQAIILWTAGGTATRTITVPAQSKSYIVINKTSSSQSIKIVGVGPTTGVTIVAGTAAFVVWNGVDFVTASVTSTTGILPVANGGTGLSSGTSGGVLAYTATGTLASSAALAASALVIGGGAGAAPSTTTTGTGVVTALGVNVGTAGAFVVNGGVLGTPSSGTLTNATGLPISTGVSGLGTGIATALAVNVGTAGSPVVNGGALGTPSSGTVTNLTGTASININGTVGATTATTGAFTTVTATSTVSASSGALQLNSVGAARTIFTNTVDGTDDGYVIITPGSSATTARGGYFAVAGNENATFGNGGNAVITAGNVSGAKVKLQFNETDVAVVSSTGLAVTGTLSATGNANFGNAGSSTYGGYATGGRIFSLAAAGGVIPAISASTDTFAGSTAFRAYTKEIANDTSYAFEIQTGNGTGVTTQKLQLTWGANGLWNSTGLAVTGTLSSTLGATIQGLTVGLGAGAVATNTAVGASALAANTTGDAQVAVGYEALKNNVGGYYNTAVGYSASRDNVSGFQNVAYGFGALLVNVSGAYNVAVGKDALVANLASNNTAVGFQAGYNLITSGENTAVGYQALYTNTASGDNVAVGRNALKLATGAGNTVIGEGGGSAITTGAKNTILGRYTGNQHSLDITTASNYIVLSDGDGNPRAYWNNSGGVQFTSAGVAGFTLLNTNNVSGDTGIFSQLGGNCSNTSSAAFSALITGVGNKFYVYGNGNVVNTNNSYGAISDIKFKENVVDATPKLDDVMRLKVRNFNLKTESDNKQIGFIAQEFEEVFPSMIDVSPDTDVNGQTLETTHKSIKLSVLVPILVKAIQELKAEVDSLKSQLNGASA